MVCILQNNDLSRGAGSARRTSAPPAVSTGLSHSDKFAARSPYSACSTNMTVFLKLVDGGSPIFLLYFVIFRAISVV